MEILLRWITFSHHFKSFQKFATAYFATDFKGSEVEVATSFNFEDYYRGKGCSFLCDSSKGRNSKTDIINTNCM